MTDTIPFTQPLKSLLVFGASGHIGNPLASHIAKTAPNVRLRLATSSEKKVAVLKEQFPSAEVVVCSYYNQGQLNSAFEGIEGVFIVTPDFTDEVLAMGNLVNAAKNAGNVLRHIVRLVADAEDIELAQTDIMPDFLREAKGASIGHNLARRAINASNIPATYINIIAFYFDDLISPFALRPIKEIDTLVEVDCHPMGYIDPAEVGEASANLLLRRNPADIGAIYLVQDGETFLPGNEVAEMLGEELGRKINYIAGYDAYKEWIVPGYDEVLGEGAGDYFAKYFVWEGDVVRAGGVTPGENSLPEILGRKPKTLREWVRENRAHFE